MVEKSLFLGTALGGSSKSGSTTEGYSGKDWIQLMMHSHLRREDVIRHLLESMKQPVDKKKESEGPVSDKKPRDLPPLDLGIPVPGVGLTREVKGARKRLWTG